MIPLSEIKARALAATPDEWGVYRGVSPDGSKRVGIGVPGSDEGIIEIEDNGWTDEADLEFIAAANPAAVLEMVAEIERLRAEAARLWWSGHTGRLGCIEGEVTSDGLSCENCGQRNPYLPR